MASSRAPRYFDPAPHRDQTTQADLCIYGGTPGGIIAAVEAASRGRRVVLIEPGARLGGMTAGGLGMTDIGSRSLVGAVGGLAREFYRRVGRHYGDEEEWCFEPGVAEKIFETWLAETDVRIFRRHFVASAVARDGCLESLSTLGGLTVRARMFIDASYEGDLMARAGVSHRVGREAASAYGEEFNGMHVRDNRFEYPVDPYVVPGAPGSGLLPGVEAGEDYVPGAGDHRIQAYNFRMCLTRRPDLRIPFARPAAYDESWYVLLGRYLAAGWTDLFHKFDPVRNGKTDTNNHGAISTDFIGQNHAYPFSDYADRERIYQAHVAYQQGLMWFLANDPRVPAPLRSRMSEWGLARDEFVETGGWPHALYVRESRRMVSDLVMTARHCLGAEIVEDAAGLAAHGMDSHTCRRIVRNGVVLNEGDVQIHDLKPYPISYRSLVPRKAECRNLLVPFCLSASHIAFGSIRMEPVLMVLGQTCAIAADLALAENCALQDLPYSSLRPELHAAGQVLGWPAPAKPAPRPLAATAAK